MEKTYIHISITYYSNPRISPDVHYFRATGNNPYTSTWNKLTPAEANQLMWELIKLGGKNSYKANWFNNAISTREVTFWGQL